jgi:hypothetical protein
LKCGAGEEKRRSVEPIVSEMGCYKRVKKEINVQQKTKKGEEGGLTELVAFV